MASKPASGDPSSDQPTVPAEDETQPTPPDPNGPVPEPGSDPWIEGP